MKAVDLMERDPYDLVHVRATCVFDGNELRVESDDPKWAAILEDLLTEGVKVGKRRYRRTDGLELLEAMSMELHGKKIWVSEVYDHPRP